MRQERMFIAFLVILLGMFWPSVKADVVPRPVKNGDNGIGLSTFILTGVVILVIAALSYLLLRRIRRRGQKDAGK